MTTAPPAQSTSTDADSLPISRPPTTSKTPVTLTPAQKRARRGPILRIWDTSIGKKWVMAVTGLLMMAFLLVHMLGNLKIFFGAEDFDNYAGWLRTIGTPVLHKVWYLWIQRFVLLLALVLHVTAAAQLSARDVKARPVKYQGRSAVAGGALKTKNMRYGGTFLLLFIIWHLLDLSSGTVASGAFHEGAVYENVVHDFHYWYEDVIYLVSMVALGLHIYHAFWSASMTLGYNKPLRNKGFRIMSASLAVIIAGGFCVIPIAVMVGGLS